jgi:hypothetical protein
LEVPLEALVHADVLLQLDCPDVEALGSGRTAIASTMGATGLEPATSGVTGHFKGRGASRRCWLGPAKAEVEAVRRALAPGGRVFLFYETPGPERARHAAQRLTAVLQAEAFTEPEWLTPTPTLFGCVTAPRT